MIWPFKKKEPPLTTEQWAAQFPLPPCGKQTEHYEWEKINGMTCPFCCADQKRREKDAELDRLVDKIVARMRSQGRGCGSDGGKENGNAKS